MSEINPSLIAATGVLACILSWLGISYFRRWAEKRRLLDHPNERSSHSLPTPRGAGVVFASVSLAGLWAVFLLSAPATFWPAMIAWTLGTALIAVSGLLDDLWSLPQWLRFAAQSLGASIAIAGLGYWRSIDLPLLGSVDLHWAGLGLTFLWIVGLTNAYNFMDGIDGLAGGQAIIAGLGWLLFGWNTGQPIIAAFGALIAGSSLGFLSHNWPPARTFMGDVGSTFLGFSFAIFPLLSAATAPSEMDRGAPFIGFLLVWPFVFDTVFTFLRRLGRGEKVFAAHRSHLYQRLTVAGLKPRTVTLIYLGLASSGLLLSLIWSPSATEGAGLGVLALPALALALWLFVDARERIDAKQKIVAQVKLVRHRLPLIVLSQAVLLTAAYLGSFLLRLDFELPDPFRSTFLETLPLVLIIKFAVFSFFGLFKGWWRYTGMSDLLDIFKAAAVSALLIIVSIYFTHGLLSYPRSVLLIDPILTVFLIGGARFLVRAFAENVRFQMARTNTLIVGAGNAGGAIAKELKINEESGYHPIGFVDDDPSKAGIKIQGIKVLGSIQDMPRIIAENQVSHILIAIPSASGEQIQKIVGKCKECRVDFKTLPGLSEIINGSVTVGQIRNVRLEDLLKRKPVNLDLTKIQAEFEAKTVLVTGAAGSIGSELCRQIAQFRPNRLVLFDRSESDLHDLHRELADRLPAQSLAPIIGDILDLRRLREAFATHRPNVVYHAAAYKHVPMMEDNCFEAVENNILGTFNVASTAAHWQVDSFILISTDKAVNPANIMGVTKRVAELMVLALQQHATRFVSVRFGNVLGSKGSVVATFEKQIAQRRPLTITHPEAKRYFMTVHEAVQLVLQASVMGIGGEIFVLDMGEPAKIVNLAKDLIRLSGLEPGVDIAIVYTGLRPGEKIFEDLRLQAEGLKPTSHRKIHVLDGGTADLERVKSWLDDIVSVVESRDMRGLIAKLQEIVPEYHPSQRILSHTEGEGRHDSDLPQD